MRSANAGINIPRRRLSSVPKAPSCRRALRYPLLPIGRKAFEKCLRVCIALRSRFLPPFGRLGIVLGYAIARVVHDGDLVLRKLASLLGGFFIPLCRLGGILGNAVPGMVPPGETHHIFCAASLGFLFYF